MIVGLKERLTNNPMTPCTFCFQQEPQFPPICAEGARVILLPPVTQFIHGGARDSAKTISLETKLAKNKPSMGLLLSLAVLCLLSDCISEWGNYVYRAPSATRSEPHNGKKNMFLCTGFLHDFIFWCFMWFQLSLVLFPLEGLSQPLSLTQTLLCVPLVLAKS